MLLQHPTVRKQLPSVGDGVDVGAQIAELSSSTAWPETMCMGSSPQPWLGVKGKALFIPHPSASLFCLCLRTKKHKISFCPDMGN